MAWRVGEDFRYISLFSGIEAATVAWESCEWKPVAFSDFDDFPSAVLAHHYPDIPNLGDVTEVNWDEYRGKADLVVGGSPCQAFSVAGQRLGLADPRGNLALHFLRVVEAVQPRWFLFENVAGLLSSDGGRDFATFLGEVANIGYGFAYRILDAKHFGVAQRRRRVFVVGHIGGDWRRAASVLFERESLCGDPTPRQAQREAITANVGSGPIEESATASGTRGMNPEVAGCITTNIYHNQGFDNQTVGTPGHLIIDEPKDKILSFDSTFGANSNVFEDETPQLKVGSSGGGMPPAVAFDWKNITQTNPSEKNTDPLTREGSLAIGFNQNQDEKVGDLKQGTHFRKSRRAQNDQDFETWVETEETNTLNTFDNAGDVRATELVVEEAEVTTIRTGGPWDDPKLFINEPDDKVFLAANPMSDRKMAVFDARGNGEGDVSNTLVGDHQGRVTDYTAVAVEGVDLFNQELTGEEHAPLRTAQGHGAPAVAIQDTSSRDKAQNGKGWKDDGSAYTLDTKGLQGANIGMAVRRLTPIECERLQGFPDNYTQIAWKKKAKEDCPDGHRFKALGNSMAVPVMRWLGQRIALVDAIPIGDEAHNTGTDWL